MRPSYLKFRRAGLVPAGGGRFLAARGGSIKDHGHTGRLVPALSDKERGLKLAEK